jgi:phosphoglycolate phosphatase-like HAD superfamily hydrolase
MTKNNQNKRLIALDFDGVIIDSIVECFQVSKEVYYGFSQFPFDEDLYKNLFFEFRGLVGPACEYLALHKILEKSFINDDDINKNSYEQIKLEIDQDTFDCFEYLFFSTRTYYQKTNFHKWIELNPITDFGKNLISRSNKNVFIVTTKNRIATEALLSHYNISVESIYTNDEIKELGSKGKLISHLIDKEKADEVYFIDDSVVHLDTVNDKRIKCFFADWGYGEIGEKKDSFIEELRLEDIEKKFNEFVRGDFYGKKY